MTTDPSMHLCQTNNLQPYAFTFVNNRVNLVTVYKGNYNTNRKEDLSGTLIMWQGLHAKVIHHICNFWMKFLTFKIHQNFTFNNVQHVMRNSILNLRAFSLSARELVHTDCHGCQPREPASSLPFLPFHRWCHWEGTSCQLFSNLSKINILLLK